MDLKAFVAEMAMRLLVGLMSPDVSANTWCYDIPAKVEHERAAGCVFRGTKPDQVKSVEFIVRVQYK